MILDHLEKNLSAFISIYNIPIGNPILLRTF